MIDIFVASKVFHKDDFIGGTDNCLDSIDGAILQDGDTASVYKSVGNYIVRVDFLLDADSATAESSPDVISPDSNAGTKRWIRCSPAVCTGTAEPTSPFEGLVWIDSSA